MVSPIKEPGYLKDYPQYFLKVRYLPENPSPAIVSKLGFRGYSPPLPSENASVGIHRR